MCRVADDDPRWRQSASGYGCNAAERMGPPPRSLARRSVSLLHGQDPGFNRIQAWFAFDPRANGRLPSDPCAANHPIAAACRRARRRWKYAVGAEECSAARVEQKNGITKQDKNGVTPLTRKAPYKPAAL